MTRLAMILAALTLSLAVLAGSAGCRAERWQVEEKVTFQGVEMTLRLSSENVEPGAMLDVNVQVKNTSGAGVEYTMWNSGDPPVYLRLEPPYGDAITLRAPGEPEIVQPVVTFGILEAGETIERQVQWDVTIPVGSAAVDAPNGTYTVAASFFPGRQVDRPEPEPLRLAHPVMVTGGADLIDAERAEQIAFNVPSVQLWVSGHTGAAVAREQKGTYTVNMGGEWQAADQELYEQARAAGEAAAVDLTLGDDGESLRWQVHFASKFGFPPSEMTVLFDATSGEVLTVTPDLEAELEGGVVATFAVGNSRFRIFVTNPETIEELYRLQSGESRANIPNGPLLSGPGAGMHNVPWSWHLDPEQTQMAEITIEVCDGTPDFVEEDLAYWLDQVGQYCPWSAELVDIADHR